MVSGSTLSNHLGAFPAPELPGLAMPSHLNHWFSPWSGRSSANTYFHSKPFTHTHSHKHKEVEYLFKTISQNIHPSQAKNF